MEVEEKLDNLCNKNKGAHQLSSYCTKAKFRFSHDGAQCHTAKKIPLCSYLHMFSVSSKYSVKLHVSIHANKCKRFGQRPKRNLKDLHVFPCLLRVNKGQDTRNPSGLTMTKNTGRG